MKKVNAVQVSKGLKTESIDSLYGKFQKAYPAHAEKKDMNFLDLVYEFTKVDRELSMVMEHYMRKCPRMIVFVGIDTDGSKEYVIWGRAKKRGKWRVLSATIM
ncbi:hypothetical protein [Levilactobacillus brevis]|uniref:hypothetical protein n=1 Tax=Levilactobacillus brevis TaxID=1580 RepID=UPI001CDD36E2|nr:hypothetical protein [Levilactobacillus brevis]